jgi:Holliday junction resolvase
MASEKQFENKIKKFLKDEGCWFLKYWAGAAYTKSGIPDLLICCNGYFLGVEVKAPRGKPSELQLWNIEKIKEAGGIGLVLYPKDFDSFKELIHKLNQEPKKIQLSSMYGTFGKKGGE